MAKYEDYQQKESIEDEIEVAAEATATRQEPDLPDQFKDKSAADIAQSYQELKSMSDRQANELGALRKTQTELTSQLLNSSHQEAAETKQPITVDDLYEDPEGVISRAVDARVSGKLEELDGIIRGMKTTSAMKDLEGKYPTFREDAQSPEMRNWISESGYRQRLASAADQGDLQAADDLIGMYYDLNGTKAEQAKVVTRERQLRDAGLESGSGAEQTSTETYSRSKLELARRRAKRGNHEAQQYLTENKAAIYRAYEEGRIVN